ncbi:MAG: fumarylacetoacetate hydrolase family protein [Kiritimatiellae bacterium]|nr:fumarylacetoacetate hydrolase family protein [Kiritimatiellia bacterium]
MKLTLGSTAVEACRIFCIAQNYPAHAEEMKSVIPTSPVIFLKPPTSLVPAGGEIPLPRHGRDFQHEVEVVLLVGRGGRLTKPDNFRHFVAGIGLGLDLTLRDVQREAKAKGLPWESAKAFDYSAPVGNFTPFEAVPNPDDVEFTCEVNGYVRQHGCTREMIFSFGVILQAISRIWRLCPGDLVYTGTPKGVGPLVTGDVVTVSSPVLGTFSWRIGRPAD